MSYDDDPSEVVPYVADLSEDIGSLAISELEAIEKSDSNSRSLLPSPYNTSTTIFDKILLLAELYKEKAPDSEYALWRMLLESLINPFDDDKDHEFEAFFVSFITNVHGDELMSRGNPLFYLIHQTTEILGEGDPQNYQEFFAIMFENVVRMQKAVVDDLGDRESKAILETLQMLQTFAANNIPLTIESLSMNVLLDIGGSSYTNNLAEQLAASNESFRQYVTCYILLQQAINSGNKKVSEALARAYADTPFVYAVAMYWMQGLF